MASFNQADLFSLILESLTKLEGESTGHELVFRVYNLGVEPEIFRETISEVFDEDIVDWTVGFFRIIRQFNAESLLNGLEDGGDRVKYLEKLAGEILEKLKKTPNWGEVDGANLRAPYETMD